MTQSTVSRLVTRPILKWAGSKRQLVPTLSEYWLKSKATRYVEPFAGSACLLFHLQPQEALIGDINIELIKTYRQVKKQWKAVYKELNAIPPNEEAYYELRAIDPREIKSGAKRAARFIYLNRFCFNGIYRINSSGKFNVPYGRGGTIPSEATFKEAAKILKKTTLFAGDFERTLSQVRAGDFVYMDPPYSVFNKKIFTSYDSSKFDLNKIQKLRGWLLNLDARGVNFLVSYLESDEADFLAEGFDKRNVEVRRSIAGFASARRQSREVLISNIRIM